MTQKVKNQSRAEPATVVYIWRVKKGKEEVFRKWLHNIHSDAIKFRGHLGETTIHQPNSNVYQGVLHFDNQLNLDAWLNSEVRASWLKQLDGIATEQKDKLTGLETWFELPGTAPPPKWKMVVATFIGVYPVVLVLGWLIVPHLGRFNFFIRELLFPVLLPILLTYLLMPFITQKLLRRWLYK